MSNIELPASAAVSDVVVVPVLADDGDWSGATPAGGEPVQLLPDLQLRRLSRAEVREYIAACQPKDLHFKGYGDDAHRYAFVRHPVETSLNEIHGFDRDGVMHAALALSRYLVLNSHCTQYAVRRIEGVYDDHPVQIKSVDPENRFYAWRVVDGSRGSLTQDQAKALGPLLTTYVADRDRLPPRVRTAIWFCEYSFRQSYYEVAMAHVVTGLEALTKVDRRDASRQFRTRVPALAREVDVPGVTMAKARQFYRRRSQTVHGQRLKVSTATPATRDLALMQRLLTSVLRQAIEDRQFRAHFTGPKIKVRWPI